MKTAREREDGQRHEELGFGGKKGQQKKVAMVMVEDERVRD